MSYFKMLK